MANTSGSIVFLACVTLTWTFEHGGLSAWLDELYVHKEYRYHGIGTALLKRVIAETRSRGCLGLDLEVDKDHQSAENLYVREGFQLYDCKRWFLKLA